MANAEQLNILKQGVELWNRWREKHPDEKIDLSGADLNKVKLNGVNFRQGNLKGVNLREAELYDAHFAGASLQGADLYGAFLKKTNCYHADFRRVNLCRAMIQQANLSGINLQGSNLTDVDFRTTILSRANLRDTIMTGAKLYATARDDWEISDIVCNHIYWDKKGEQRTPLDRNFRPGEFEELYKQLPTFDYIFEHGFTPIDAVVMDRVVQAINEEHPEFELTLDSFQSRGQPHAKFTVLHKEAIESAKQEVTRSYEERFAALEGKQEQMMQLMSMMVNNPQKIELIMGNKQITAGNDYFEHVGGGANISSGDTYNNSGQVAALGKGATATGNTFNNTQIQGDITMSAEKQNFGDNFESGGGAMNIAKDHGTATQTNYTIESAGSSGELLKLLATVRQALAALPVDESVKEEVLHEVKGAEIQAKKAEPDKPKIAAKLKDAVTALEESAKTVKGAVTLGNLLGQAITWCGENWTLWT